MRTAQEQGSSERIPLTATPQPGLNLLKYSLTFIQYDKIYMFHGFSTYEITTNKYMEYNIAERNWGEA